MVITLAMKAGARGTFIRIAAHSPPGGHVNLSSRATRAFLAACGEIDVISYEMHVLFATPENTFYG